ncbi:MULTISPECIES: peptidase S9 [unclassified Methanoculleus]|uniref:peptidase S9 n=1 Tax=unclassified Methanoculleus TaxID=2619537 RepID=UPI0025E839E0|nr:MULTISPECIES: peptidase S9 [unclassified Methanoculleus]
MDLKVICLCQLLLIAAIPPATAATIIQVTNDSSIDSYPFWSPDGRYIAFTSYSSDGVAVLRVTEPDGRDTEQTREDRAWEFAPFDPWSPDGKTLLFLSADANLWRMNPDGTERMRLTEGGRIVPGLPLAGYGADWSDDGRQIVYTSCLFDNSAVWKTFVATAAEGSPAVNYSDIRKDADIWIMDADGSNKSQLTTGGDARLPLWQPHGDLIAYLSTKSGSQEVWAMDRNGRAEQITFFEGDVTGYAWSPDGSAIACVVASLSGVWESSLWIVPLDGSGAQQLTSGSLDQSPVWSPDGGRIAFGSMSRNQSALWVMKSDGSDLEPLTPGNSIMHQWSPDGRMIAASDGDDISIIVLDDRTAPTSPGFGVTGALAALVLLPILGRRSGRRS